MAKNNNTILFGAAGLGLAALLLLGKKTPPPTPAAVKSFTGSPTDFIKQMYPYALAAKKVYPKVPYQLILAFSGLESGWGKAAPGFNFFGTKPGPAWKGEKQLITTTEILPKKSGYNFPKVISVTDSTKYPGKYTWKVQDYFRKYPTPLDAFLDFCKFITSGRYAKAFLNSDIKSIIAGIDIMPLDPEDGDGINGIWKAGYATDPGYVDKIMKLVDVINKVIAN